MGKNEAARYQITTNDGDVYVVSDVTVVADAIVARDVGDDGQNEDVTIQMAEIESVKRMTAGGQGKALCDGNTGSLRFDLGRFRADRDRLGMGVLSDGHEFQVKR